MRNTLFFLGILVFLMSCSGGLAPKDRLVVAIDSNPTTFDPRLAVDAVSMKINNLIYSGLVKFDDDFNFIPNLAESYEQTEPTVYKFHLRKNVKFHSGKPVTVDDVIYTFKSCIDGTVASPLRVTLDFVKEIKKESDDTVVFILKGPHAPFLTAMVKGIVPKDEAVRLGKDYGLQPVGSGPYKFQEFASDSKVILKRNDEYYGDVPRLPYLEFKVLKDENVRVLQLMKGMVDLIQNGVPPLMVDKLKENKDIAIEVGPSIIFDYMGMNLNDPVLAKVGVRKALAYGIDRDEIIRHKWGGYARIADTLLSPMHWAFSGDVEKYNYDPEKAKALLDVAGYPDPDGDGPKSRIGLSYKTSTQKSRIDIANLIAEQLRKIGISVTVTPYEWGTFFKDIANGSFQLYSLSWVGVSEPDIYYNIYHSSQIPPVGQNRNRYINKEIDRLTEEGRVEVDREKRREIYAKIQRIVSGELPYIPLWYTDNILARRKNVVGFNMRSDAGFENFVYATKE